MTSSARLRRAIKAILRRVLTGEVDIDVCVLEIEQLIDEEKEDCKRELSRRLQIEAMRLKP